MEQKTTRKEQFKESRLLIVKEADNLENLVKNNVVLSNFPELLFSVAKIKQIAKSHNEVLRLALSIATYHLSEEKFQDLKNALYSNLVKILENIDTQN